MWCDRDRPIDESSAPPPPRPTEAVSRSLLRIQVAECPLCLDLLQDARILDCGHTFCYVRTHLRAAAESGRARRLPQSLPELP